MALVNKSPKSPLADAWTLDSRVANLGRHSATSIFEILKNGLRSFVRRVLIALDASRRREAARIIRQYWDLIDRPPE